MLVVKMYHSGRKRRSLAPLIILFASRLFILTFTLLSSHLKLNFLTSIIKEKKKKIYTSPLREKLLSSITRN